MRSATFALFAGFAFLSAGLLGSCPPRSNPPRQTRPPSE